MLYSTRETRRVRRRYPIGAELIGPDQAHFRVWAPKAQRVDLILEGSAAKTSGQTFQGLEAEENGYFFGAVKAGAGDRYRFRVNKNFYPDPASRFQWNDSQWPGVPAAGLKGQVIYEMHVGTFTKEGTWPAASQQLEELARIGITVIEMMPVADFPGKFGWGYDGVDLF